LWLKTNYGKLIWYNQRDSGIPGGGAEEMSRTMRLPAGSFLVRCLQCGRLVGSFLVKVVEDDRVAEACSESCAAELKIEMKKDRKLGHVVQIFEGEEVEEGDLPPPDEEIVPSKPVRRRRHKRGGRNALGLLIGSGVERVYRLLSDGAPHKKSDLKHRIGDLNWPTMAFRNLRARLESKGWVWNEHDGVIQITKRREEGRMINGNGTNTN
jgi:hypothetical protein